VTALAPADVAARAGLSTRDYHAVCERLGREPNAIEARMFGVMWSEHCGYKHSKGVLRRLPSSSPRVLTGPGENAGVVSIGRGWALAFKMESHNHPSAVDPYNGAATGVGGIIRDILAMGARPVALLDSLRFGPLHEPRARRLCGGVVAGIAGYGNAIGVPTVGGELLTDPSYRDNPLVNVACLGFVKADRVARSAAAGPGSAVLYAGARTGRDGIGGAAFASTELDELRESEDRASVQMGDPFTGKLLIEATLEALATGAVTAVQDMGAAGLTCAASEMAANGRVGMGIDLDRVPVRESGMRPDEILMSESQERMLLVVPQAAAPRIAAIYRRWGLDAEVIGTVTAEPRLIVAFRGQIVVDLPPAELASAPAYDPAAEVPEDLEVRWRLDASALPMISPVDALLTLLAYPDVASKHRMFEQYDHTVGVRTVVVPGTDAAVLRVLDAPPLGVALTADGNARWCAADPRRGAALVVLEAAANLACAGAEPVAVTDCLNFGNPERPPVFWAFRETVAGIAEACRALGVPVVGGNVSFYNEADGSGGERAVLPTPVVGMAGLVDDVSTALQPGFSRDGDVVAVAGDAGASLGASLYLRVVACEMRGRPAEPALERAAAAIAFVRQAVSARLVSSSHDVSDGGLAVSLAESCIRGGRGATIVLPRDPARLFGEAPGRFVLAVNPVQWPAVEGLARGHGVAMQVVGTVGGSRLRITTGEAPPAQDDVVLDVPIDTLAAAYNGLEV
jgi:phosphoribosylformylglycinamidine synthase